VYNADRSIAGPSLVIRKDSNWLAMADAHSLQPPQTPSAPTLAPAAIAPTVQPAPSPQPTVAGESLPLQASPPTQLTPQTLRIPWDSRTTSLFDGQTTGVHTKTDASAWIVQDQEDGREYQLVPPTTKYRVTLVPFQ
jgi:hypothetical protein